MAGPILLLLLLLVVVCHCLVQASKIMVLHAILPSANRMKLLLVILFLVTKAFKLSVKDVLFLALPLLYNNVANIFIKVFENLQDLEIND